jgi:zinc-ribbon domain
MYCPQCGANQSDEMKFCNLCGANLYAVRKVVGTRETDEKFDWGKTWVAEMFLSEEERKRRKYEIERSMDPEVRRSNEVKGGVITSCVGVALMIFLFFFMQGVIKGGRVPPEAVEILSRVWLAGLIPFFVGIGLLINGLVVSKKLGTRSVKELPAKADALDAGPEPRSLRSADTNEFITPGFSVTEGTTKHLSAPGRKQ